MNYQEILQTWYSNKILIAGIATAENYLENTD
jgi:hypothetical protein